MAGRKKILLGSITQGKTRGPALASELAQALNQSEKESNYENRNTKTGKK